MITIRLVQLLAFAVLMIFPVASCAGESVNAGSVEQHYVAVLEEHRVRVEVERKKIEEKHRNCLSCKGKGIVSDESVCLTCRGTGMTGEKKGKATLYKECPKCHGAKMIVRRKPCPKCRPYDLGKTGQQDAGDEGKVTKAEEQRVKCSRCLGKGYFSAKETCRSCKGNGKVYAPPSRMISGESRGRMIQCNACRGSGNKMVGQRCQECGGKGFAKVAAPAQTKQEDVQKDIPEIVKWYKHAAEKGSAKDQCCIGVMYAAGDVVDKNPSEAVKWFRAAAEKGNADAQFLLGESYAVGAGVAKDKAEAEKWLRKASDAGYDKKQCELGIALVQQSGKPPVGGAGAQIASDHKGVEGKEKGSKSQDKTPADSGA